MDKIEFIKDKIPFTQVANGVLLDKRISAKAKGLYAYLYSKPDGWDFAVKRIVLEMVDGEDSINEGLKELEKYGFLTRKRQGNGRVIYSVHFPPLDPNAENRQMAYDPNAENPKQGKSQTGKIGMISNKESISNKEEYNNKDILPDKSGEYDTDFLKWYNLYPRKVGKPKAHQAWKKIKPNTELKRKMVLAVLEHSKSRQWQKEDYIPYPATWLNQERWNDKLAQDEEKTNEL